MKSINAYSLGRSIALVAASTLFAACTDTAPVGPLPQRATTTLASQLAKSTGPDVNQAVATMRRVTARYHDLNIATADGFILLHPCESRPGEGPVGTVYYHPGRLLDGAIDPAMPDALIYEPRAEGRPRLVGVEFAVPNTGQVTPTLLGATFQREDEFGVFALHAWVWRLNPEGLFAETNRRVSCGEE
jgi:hypothetical protein